MNGVIRRTAVQKIVSQKGQAGGLGQVRPQLS